MGKKQLGNIAINGFGRIGRLFLRQCLLQNLPVVAINDISLNPRYVAYMLKFDSSQGRFKNAICLDGNNLIIGEQKISLSFEADPKNIKWAEMDAKYVVDCTGKFKTIETARAHLRDGVDKVFISAPSMDAPMFVVGVNMDTYKIGTKVISCGSCTTNCLAPLAKIVHNKYQIDEGLMTTVHAATTSQMIIDSATTGKSWRSSRSGMSNIIPYATGAAQALGKVIPDLNGKVTGLAFRVPISTVSVVDFTCRLANPAKFDEIKSLFREAANGEMKDIITYVDDEVVSSDFVGSKFAAAFDARASIGLSDKFVKLIAWYDNESGYAAQLARLVKHCLTADFQAEEQRKEKERKENEKKLKEEEEMAQKEAQEKAEKELKAKVLAECFAKIEKEEKQRAECEQMAKKQQETDSKTKETKKHPCEELRGDEKKLAECCANLKQQIKEKKEQEVCAQKEKEKKQLAERNKKLEKCFAEKEKIERSKLEKARKEKEQKLKDEKKNACSEAEVQQLAEGSNALLEKVLKACAEREEKQKQLAKCCAELAKKQKEEKEKRKKDEPSEKQQKATDTKSKMKESCKNVDSQIKQLAQLCEERKKTNKEVMKLYAEIEKKLEECAKKDSSKENKKNTKDPCTKEGEDSKKK